MTCALMSWSTSPTRGSPPGRAWPLHQEICTTLYISMATTKTHIGRLLAKLDARDRAQLVIAATKAALPADGSRTWPRRQAALVHRRTVAAKRSSFPVRVSFHTRWKASAPLAIPCQSPSHQVPYFPREAVDGSRGSKEAVVTRSGGPNRSRPALETSRISSMRLFTRAKAEIATSPV